MRRFIDKGLWVILYLMFPITVIGLIAQNSIPGELLYPIKIGMENVGAFVFSLTPEAKASFNSTISQRRFDEAQRLITNKANTSGLNTLLAQTIKTQESVDNIKNAEQKDILQRKLIKDIDDYQTRLTQTQQKVNPTYLPPTPTSISIKSKPIRINHPNPITNNQIFNPIITATPTLTQSIVAESPSTIIDEIEKAKQKLQVIKQTLESQSIETETRSNSVPNPIISTSTDFPGNTDHPNSTLQPQVREENEQNNQNQSNKGKGSNKMD